MSENYVEPKKVDEPNEKIIDVKPSLKEKIFNKKNLKKGAEILAIIAGAVGAVVVLGKIATPAELGYPEEDVPYDEGGTDESDNG